MLLLALCRRGRSCGSFVASTCDQRRPLVLVGRNNKINTIISIVSPAVRAADKAAAAVCAATAATVGQFTFKNGSIGSNDDQVSE